MKLDHLIRHIYLIERETKVHHPSHLPQSTFTTLSLFSRICHQWIKSKSSFKDTCHAMHIPYIHQWILRNPQLNWIEGEKKKKSNFCHLKELMIYFSVTPTAHHFHDQDIFSLHIDIFSSTRTRHDRHKNLPSTVVQTWCKLKSISSPTMKVVSSDNWIHFYNFFF